MFYLKQALKVVDEIKRLKEAKERSKSVTLKNDYSKGIWNLTAELKEYCGYKNLNFKEIMKEVV